MGVWECGSKGVGSKGVWEGGRVRGAPMQLQKRRAKWHSLNIIETFVFFNWALMRQ